MGLGIKTYVRYKWNVLCGKNTPFGLGYHEWQSKRIRAMLDHYGVPFFSGKTILELGAGHGDIGNFFSMLGSKVTCLEGRASHVQEMKKRHPSLTGIEFDLNKDIPKAIGKVDLMIHFGVLYHLSDPEKSLRDACKHCDRMVLETECVDSNDPNFVRPIKEGKYVNDHAINGLGCSPSPAFIERVLSEEGMEFEMVKDARCNAGEHQYDWPLLNTGVTKKAQRRFWFVSRK